MYLGIEKLGLKNGCFYDKLSLLEKLQLRPSMNMKTLFYFNLKKNSDFTKFYKLQPCKKFEDLPILELVWILPNGRSPFQFINFHWKQQMKSSI